MVEVVVTAVVVVVVVVFWEEVVVAAGVVVVVVTAYIGVNKFTDWVYEEDMKFQYQGEYYKEVV